MCLISHILCGPSRLRARVDLKSRHRSICSLTLTANVLASLSPRSPRQPLCAAHSSNFVTNITASPPGWLSRARLLWPIIAASLGRSTSAPSAATPPVSSATTDCPRGASPLDTAARSPLGALRTLPDHAKASDEVAHMGQVERHNIYEAEEDTPSEVAAALLAENLQRATAVIRVASDFVSSRYAHECCHK